MNAIGVTVGPGLEICLRVRYERAKVLAGRYGKPFICVHHVNSYPVDLTLTLQIKLITNNFTHTTLAVGSTHFNSKNNNRVIQQL